MNSKEIIAENIRKLRKEKGVSQEVMARDIGLNPVTIRYYEYGERFPKPEALDLIADYFKVPVSHLFDLGKKLQDEDDSLNLMKQITSLGPKELEILKENLEVLSRPRVQKEKKKEA